MTAERPATPRTIMHAGRLWFVAICLTLGVATAIISAQCIAIWGPRTPTSWKKLEGDLASHWNRAAPPHLPQPGADWHVNAVLDSRAGAMDFTEMELQRIGEQEWCKLHVVQAGWPFSSMSRKMSYRVDTQFRVAKLWSNAAVINLSKNSRGGRFDNLNLPTRPIAAGLLANSLLFAIAFAAFFALLTTLRRANRRRRGLCPLCRYDLKGGAGCPECGWGKVPPGATPQ